MTDKNIDNIVQGKKVEEKPETATEIINRERKERVEKPVDKEETITISRTLLESIQEQVKDTKEKITMLEATADKKQLSAWYSKHKEKIPQEVKLRTFPVEGKDKEMSELVVLRSRMVKDLGSFKIGNAWREEQEIELMFENGTTKKMPYGEYIHGYKKVMAKVISKNIDEMEGTIILKVVRSDNNQEFDIDIRFIN